jgi:primosomal protein N' (replication factor Y)
MASNETFLFPDSGQIPDLPAPATEGDASAHEGPFAGVALEQGIDRALDYAIPERLAGELAVGQRVRVPLGKNNRPTHGYVVSILPTTKHPKVKKLLDIVDPRVLLSPKMMDLVRWMSRYYVTPLGQVIDSVLPSAVKKKIGVGYTQNVRLIKDRAEVQALLEKTKAPKRRAILARLLLLGADESVELAKLAGEAGSTIPTVRKLARAGLISIKHEVDLPTWAGKILPVDGTQKDVTLNDDQQKAFDELKPRLAGGFSVNLLHGVTGSGKTEVYLQCIREAVTRGRQAIVLVPEIALTPQTVRRFEARFERVAILHSGLSAGKRHRFWQQITQGLADVIVGARSAVFAPTPNLGVIIVDEEHESSYKQDSAPRYHGRDVAIKRGQLEDVPVILGSATPSLESFWRAKRAAARASETESASLSTALKAESSDAVGLPVPSPAADRSVHHLLSLPNRVRGLEMPHIELVDMKQEMKFRRGIHLIGTRMEHLLKATLEAKHQAILLLNRRGYSNYVYCPSCTHLVQCKYCDTTMTYHRMADAHAAGASSAEGVHTGQLHCHYCLAVNALPGKCPECGKKLSLFGLGTQRVEEELARKFPDLKFARVDSDTMRSAKDYEALLARFADKEIQVMLGTQMIAKGLDYPNVTLVGVINGDTALSLPDFRAAERTFQLITQVAGRAGRGDFAGRVVLQTFQPDDPTIRAAIRQDFLGFANVELSHRKEIGLPPFSRMARIILRDQDQEKLHLRAADLAADIAAAIEDAFGQPMLPTSGRPNAAALENPIAAAGAGPAATVPASAAAEVKMKGPMPCAINRIAGYYRYQIVLTAAKSSLLQTVLAAVRKKGELTKADRVAVDVDPVSLL